MEEVIQDFGKMVSNVDQDYEKSYELLKTAIEGGALATGEYLGKFYRDGVIVEQDYETAADLFWQAWEEGDEEAKELYDELVSEGKIPEDYQPKDVSDLKLP